MSMGCGAVIASACGPTAAKAWGLSLRATPGMRQNVSATIPMPAQGVRCGSNGCSSSSLMLGMTTVPRVPAAMRSAAMRSVGAPARPPKLEKAVCTISTPSPLTPRATSSSATRSAKFMGVPPHMLIFALNCGSSSLKCAAIDTDRRHHVLDVRVEEVDQALRRLREESGPPDAIVHRIVHGGERFLHATRIDDGVLSEIEQLSHLAPLHNPPALAAVRQARTAYPQAPQVAVFDTAFHSTLPAHAHEYALPRNLRERFGIRRYGFHGISHSHVMHAVAAQLRLPLE